MKRFINHNISRLKFKNNHIVYENFVKCTVKDYEFNLSYNPTLLSGSQGLLVPYSSSIDGDIFYITPSGSNFGVLKDFAQGKGDITTYDLITSTGTISAGGINIGNQGDDVVTQNIPIGFDFVFYNKAYSTVNLSSNGNLQFTTSFNSYSPRQLPVNFGPSNGFGPSIFPFFTDLLLTISDRPDAGIYTQTLGSVGSRIFCVEWKGVFFNDRSKNVNFQIRLYETTNIIELVYGIIDPANVVSVIGIQKNFNDFVNFKQYSFNSSAPSNGTLLTFNPILSNFVFSPYVTSVGLYNDVGDLLAVGKMSAPMPLSNTTDTTFLIKYDSNFISDLIPMPSPSATPSVTPSITVSPSMTPSITLSPSVTPSITLSPSMTPSITLTPSLTPSITLTPSLTPSITRTPSLTPSVTRTPSVTPTPSLTPTPSTSTSSVKTFRVINTARERNFDYIISAVGPQQYYDLDLDPNYPGATKICDPIGGVCRPVLYGEIANGQSIIPTFTSISWAVTVDAGPVSFGQTVNGTVSLYRNGNLLQSIPITDPGENYISFSVFNFVPLDTIVITVAI